MVLIRAAIAAFALGALVACEAPRIVESSAAACINGVDDDGDGASDCDDVDCAGTIVCETTLESCRNGADDDGNGLADCEDPRCLELAAGPCEPYPADCDPVTRAGCAAGMSCFVRLETDGTLERWCELPGELGEGATCPESTPQACGLGLLCPAEICAPACRTDDDCGGESRCLPFYEDGAFGACSVPCTPFAGGSSCDVGQLCAALHSLAYTFSEGGAVFACFPETAAGIFRGAAIEGERCAEEASLSTPARSVCRPELACVPDVDGVHTCRRPCSTPLRGEALGCEDCERCVPAYPLENEGVTDSTFVTGYCECEAPTPAGEACRCAD